MATPARYTCKYCNKSNFKSYNGLKQHIASVKRCCELSLLDGGELQPVEPPLQPPLAAFDIQPSQSGPRIRKTRSVGRERNAETPDSGHVGEDHVQNNFPDPAQMGDDSDEDAGFPDAGYSSSSDESSTDLQYVAPADSAVCTEALDKFMAYVKWMDVEYLPFTKHEAASIRLLDCLRRKRATLDTYPEVMEWHLRETGELTPHMQLGDYTNYHTRKTIINKLNIRYNGPAANSTRTKQKPKPLFNTKHTVLPVSKAKVELIYHDARDCIVSLLTDPRFTDDDWQHFDNDPLAPPPDDLQYYGDTLTSEAYLATHKELIKDPTKQMLLSVQLYIDGAISGQFGKLPVEALKIGIGNMTDNARKKRYAWRILGFVPNYHKATSRGKKMFVESGHIASMNLDLSDEEGEEEGEQINWDVADSSEDEDENSVDLGQVPENLVINPDKMEYDEDAHEGQDWHHILAHLLLTYRQQLDRKPMLWHYKYRGKVYENMELHFFVHFVKCDGDEADKLCGKYTTRTGNVQNLCRFCTCPTSKSSWVFGEKHAKTKTEPMIKKLVDENDLQELKKLSQRNLVNAFHGIRFGLHNDTGIHGACPIEMLHHILLGMFKYVITGFREQIGRSSFACDEINALAKTYGKLFMHNSDRNLPKTSFGKGIFQGKIMGKEYAGVLLVTAAILQSTMGQKLLKSSRHFKHDWQRIDWALLVETMLEWEAFLKQDQMDKNHVRKLQDKHRYLMYLMKKVLRRTKGMGMDFMKFHGILHLVELIIANGVPNVVDTGPNESHHKPTKYYSTLTQKNETTFEKQTALREDEFHLIDLAMLELEGKCFWEYLDVDQERGPPTFKQYDAIPIPKSTDPAQKRTGGSRITVWRDEKGESQYGVAKDKNHNHAWDAQVVDYLLELQEKMEQHGIDELDIRCEHKREGVIFRGHPQYRGTGQWNDWVKLDWGRGHGHLPAEIWCFVDFSNLSDTVSVKYGDVTVTKGVYAVVESSEYVFEDKDGAQVKVGSDLFRVIRKEIDRVLEDDTIARKFYLAEVEAFVDPICVIPDIGCEDRISYFEVLPRDQWSDEFIKWLEAPKRAEMDEMKEDEGVKEYKTEVDYKAKAAKRKRQGATKEEPKKAKKKKKKKK